MKKINLFLAAVAIGAFCIGDAQPQQQNQAPAQKDQATPRFVPQPIDSAGQRERDIKAFVGAGTSLQYVTEQLERKYSIDLTITDINNWGFACSDGGNCEFLCTYVADAISECICHSEQNGCSCGC